MKNKDMKMKIIVISGVPGVGKTTIASLLSSKLDSIVIDLTQFVKDKGLNDEWDDKLNTYLVDENKARDALLLRIKEFKSRTKHGHVIIEGLFSDLIADLADLAIVLRVEPFILERRLLKRGYSKEKIMENVQSEILGTCTFHMKKVKGNNFIDLDTTNMSAQEVTSTIIDILQGKLEKTRFKPGLIDWIKKDTDKYMKFF
ncbi:MAG: adenylate kinase family protein [Promethearchaeota archaeon]